MVPRLLLIIPVLLLLAAGCGYHNPNVAAEAAAETAPRLYLAKWENKTNELGLESTLHRTLNKNFRRAGRVGVARSSEGADLLLTGTIERISLPGLSYGLYDQAQEVAATLTVSYSLKAGATGEVIRKGTLTFQESFVITQDSASAKSNKQQALSQIANDLAARLYQIVQEDL